ncbi:MAG: hypothetical protein WD967_00330, partial [Candidatus Levyibacteriota bacterium]
YLKKSEELKAHDFVMTLPKELASTFDIWTLLPLPKFEDTEHFDDEVIKKLDELKTFDLKKKKSAEWKNLQA